MLRVGIKEMNDLNWYALASLVIRTISIGIILFYVIPKQFFEVLRPKNWLTSLRWYILLLFIFSILAAIPSLVYQAIRTGGADSSILRNIASILGNLSSLSTSMLLVLIYNYKKKE